MPKEAVWARSDLCLLSSMIQHEALFKFKYQRLNKESETKREEKGDEDE